MVTANDDMGRMWKGVPLTTSKVSPQQLPAVKTPVCITPSQSLKQSQNQSHILQQAPEIYTKLCNSVWIKEKLSQQ
jgi:hypothetical protein